VIVDDQRNVVAMLSDPATHGGAAVEVIETHAAVVVLAGERAYKLKRAVRFAFLDFSTPDKRREACEAEVRLNARTAPDLYLGVVPVTRGAGGLAIAGEGETVDWLVVMRRFDQDLLFDRLAARGALTEELMRDLADAIADFHAGAEPTPHKGGRAGIAQVIAGNMETLRGPGAAPFKAAEIDRLERLWRGSLEAGAGLLESRRAGGLVRWCHGDLHLRNICLIDGRPTLFDGIEFNPDIACIDVLYDLAFLLMDLQHRGLRGFANQTLNRYLGRTEDIGGCALLPLFQSLRAGVRAMVSGIEAGEGQSGMAAEARQYLDLAVAFFESAPARLIAIGGRSGTGKSTLAVGLAPDVGAAPGAVVLRSDVVRKRLFGVAPEDRLPEAAYDEEVGARVYDRLLALARQGLAAGRTVIVDAVFARPAQRAALARAASAAGVPFTGLWLDAPESVLMRRIGARAADASDATAAVVARQLAYDLGDITWARLDAGGGAAALCAAARAVIDRPAAGD
jgi:aminoglycoside phosphotransferase family enzyme/predicted kinase